MGFLFQSRTPGKSVYWKMLAEYHQQRIEGQRAIKAAIQQLLQSLKK